MGVAFVAAGIPWYTLKTVPLLQLGNAKVNVLDLLVGCTVAVGAISLWRARPRWHGLALGIVAFVGYMIVLFAVALARRTDTFMALREFRALAYYVVAAIVVVAGFTWRELRLLLAAWLAGALVGVATAVLHVYLLLPLPGYPASGATAPTQFGRIVSVGWGERISMEPTIGVIAAGYRVNYLEWTAILVAFLIAVAGVLSFRSVRGKAAFGTALLALGWYQLASAARAVQVLSLLGGLALTAALAGRRRKTVAALVVVIAAVGVGLAVRAHAVLPSWIRVPIESTVSRWVDLPADESLKVRIKELIIGFSAFRHSPVAGTGLGSRLPVPVQSDPSGIAPNIASGFGFLLFKTGIIGLGLYLVIMVDMLFLAYRQTRATRLSPAHPLAWLAVIGTGALLALNIVHKVADIPEGAIAVALFVGIATMPRPDRNSP